MRRLSRYKDSAQKGADEAQKKYLLLQVLSKAHLLDEKDQKEFDDLTRYVNTLSNNLRKAGATSVGFTSALELASKVGRFLATQR